MSNDTTVNMLWHGKRRLPSEAYAWAQQEPGVVTGAILKLSREDALCARLPKTAPKSRRKRHKWGARCKMAI